MKRKRRKRRKSFQGGGVTPSPGCHQVFPLLTACLAACRHFSTHTKQIQFHIKLKTKKIIGKYKSYLKSQLEVRAHGANTSVLFLGFCAIFFSSGHASTVFCTYLWKLTEIWMNRHIVSAITNYPKQKVYALVVSKWQINFQIDCFWHIPFQLFDSLGMIMHCFRFLRTLSLVLVLFYTWSST